MDVRNYSTEGIILARKNFGEADRLLTIYSKQYGKIRVVAKGVRLPTSRKRGAIEIFSFCKFMLAHGKNLDILTDVEVKDNFEDWRGDLMRVGVAYHLCEVVDRLTVEHQEHKEVLYSLQECLESLGALDYWQLYPLVQNFKLEVLEELGFLSKSKPAPQFDFELVCQCGVSARVGIFDSWSKDERSSRWPVPGNVELDFCVVPKVPIVLGIPVVSNDYPERLLSLHDLDLLLLVDKPSSRLRPGDPEGFVANGTFAVWATAPLSYYG